MKTLFLCDSVYSDLVELLDYAKENLLSDWRNSSDDDEFLEKEKLLDKHDVLMKIIKAGGE